SRSRGATSRDPRRRGKRGSSQKRIRPRPDITTEPAVRGVRLEPDLVQVRRDAAESEAIAEHWLDSVGTSRAFLFLHLDEPRAEYAEDFQSRSTSYDASIVRADEAVGRFIRYLKAHQLYD